MIVIAILWNVLDTLHKIVVDPGGSRTRDLLIRSQTLYPAELQDLIEPLLVLFYFR
jgi:hypothetical protein